MYEELQTITPNRETALAAVTAFEYEDHKKLLRNLLGSGAESMIRQEASEGKYNKSTHPARLEKLLANWDEILQIIQEEVPSAQEIENLLDMIDAPQSLAELGTEDTLLPDIFAATRDIRDKYVLSRLCWDLGITQALLP